MWFKQGEDKGKCGFWLKVCFEPTLTDAASNTNDGKLSAADIHNCLGHRLVAPVSPVGAAE